MTHAMFGGEANAMAPALEGFTTGRRAAKAPASSPHLPFNPLCRARADAEARRFLRMPASLVFT
jgi:hypothetical protein